MPKIAPEVSTYDFEVVLIYIFVKTWNLYLQNKNSDCHEQEASDMLHMYTNILDFVTTQSWKQNSP